MKMDKVSEDDNNEVVATVRDKIGMTRKNYVPFDELIEKFHKIRAGHMKKDRHSRIVCDCLVESEIVELKTKTDEAKRDHGRPGSARGVPREISDKLNSKKGSARRMSLPSLFHQTSSSGQTSDSPEGQQSPKAHPNHVGISCGLNRRRFSMPYVLKEYAKHDLDQLESELQGRTDTTTPRGRGDQEGEGSVERGISGKELHSFYNMWEKTRKRLKKPLPRRLAAILQDGDTDIDGARPRLFTF